MSMTPAGTHRVPAIAGAAGAGLLLMAVLAVYGNFMVVEGVVVPGDPDATAANIGDAGLSFRFGVLSLYAVAMLDVFVAWALYLALRDAQPGLSVLAGWLRAAYAAVFFVAISRLAGGDADGFQRLWDAGLMVFGASLVVVGVLVVMCAWLPVGLGVLVVLAGAGYVIDAVAAVLGADIGVSVVTFVGEVLLAVWLVVAWVRSGRAD